MNDLAISPGASMAQIDAGGQARIAAEVQRVQGAIISARRFQRDSGAALKAIEDLCAEISFAEKALFSYSRGGQAVTGPSIRLAEALIQCWGNSQAGFREVERANGSSLVYAYCCDLQTNTTNDLEFRVAHIRDTKKGGVPLTSERDIYEIVANQAARRKRACILATIPAHIVAAAVRACEASLSKDNDLPRRRQALEKAFSEHEVTVDDLERRMGKKLTAFSGTDLAQLRKIYQSLEDGMSQKTDWFASAVDPEKIRVVQEEAAKDAPPPPTPTEAAKVQKQTDADWENANKALQTEWAACLKAGLRPLEVLKLSAMFDATKEKADTLWTYADLLQAAREGKK